MFIFPLWTMKIAAKFPQNDFSLFDDKFPLIVVCQNFSGIGKVAVLVPKDLRN